MFLRQAEEAYAVGDFQTAEQILANLSRFRSISARQREEIFGRLAGLASQQKEYLAAANWYAHVLQSKSRRLNTDDPEMQRAIHNYQVLLEMAQPEEPQPTDDDLDPLTA